MAKRRPQKDSGVIRITQQVPMILATYREHCRLISSYTCPPARNFKLLR